MITTTTLAAFSLFTASTAGLQTPTIQDYLQTKLEDATIVAKIVKANQSELKKINDDFGTSYRFETTTIYLKEPFKLRAEAVVDDTSIRYIINGDTKKLFVRGRTLMTDNLTRDPGKRQTPLDFGLLTPSLFNGLFQAKFVRMDRASGNAVFDLTYVPSLKDKTRHRIWVDVDKKYVTKREWYNRRERQLATFYYEAPSNESGVWIPTRLTVKNVDDIVAGVTSYSNVKVNTGLNEKLFQN